MKASFLSYYSYYDSNGVEIGSGNHTFDTNFEVSIDAGILLEQATEWLLPEIQQNINSQAVSVIFKNLIRVS
ncbi:hypothetical protein [Lelliottia amnigena]|uniref:hypothetical protein n=1 Tax=Lelliottia amnigena TaxID=61646 RepID=UPI003B9EFAB2